MLPSFPEERRNKRTRDRRQLLTVLEEAKERGARGDAQVRVLVKTWAETNDATERVERARVTRRMR